MQKFTIKNAGATVRGPVDLRLSDMSVQQRNGAVLGSRWPAGGAFTLGADQEITLQPGDVVTLSDPAALADGAATVSRKSKAKAEEADAD